MLLSTRGWSWAGLFDNRGGRTARVLRFVMLSVPTLWTVFVINFLALGLIWAYVARSYPKLEAARFWTGLGVRRRARRSAAVVRREFGWIAAAALPAAR